MEVYHVSDRLHCAVPRRRENEVCARGGGDFTANVADGFVDLTRRRQPDNTAQ